MAVNHDDAVWWADLEIGHHHHHHQSAAFNFFWFTLIEERVLTLSDSDGTPKGREFLG